MQNSDAAQLGVIMPIGGIIMWSGAINKFGSTGKGTGTMVGWALCNGNNSTPDLLDNQASMLSTTNYLQLF